MNRKLMSQHNNDLKTPNFKFEPVLWLLYISLYIIK